MDFKAQSFLEGRGSNFFLSFWFFGRGFLKSRDKKIWTMSFSLTSHTIETLAEKYTYKHKKEKDRESKLAKIYHKRRKNMVAVQRIEEVQVESCNSEEKYVFYSNNTTVQKVFETFKVVFFDFFKLWWLAKKWCVAHSKRRTSRQLSKFLYLILKTKMCNWTIWSLKL